VIILKDIYYIQCGVFRIHRNLPIGEFTVCD